MYTFCIFYNFFSYLLKNVYILYFYNFFSNLLKMYTFFISNTPDILIKYTRKWTSNT